MILGIDFKFRDEYKEDTTAIELLTEAYKGVIFRFTNVGVKEQDDGTAVLRFGYDLLETGQWKEDKLKGDKFFEQHLGLILNTLLIDIAELDDARGTDYSEEPFEERVVYSEGSSIPEE
jgi:hypothetical protein